MAKLDSTIFPGYFQKYIDLVPEDDLATAFKNQAQDARQLLNSITEEKSNFGYAEGKWTLKELLQHLIDGERIFAYRALCFARKEQQSLPGFDENEYADNSFANQRSWQSLVDEFFLVRKTSEILFDSFTQEALVNVGTANDNPATAESFGFTMVGHVTHHLNVIKERYL